MRRTPAPLLAAALALLAPALFGVDSCGTDLLDDAGFDLWCGKALCNWEIESGAVRKVATWHPDDHGAALVGSEVAISQLSAEAGSGTTGCITFSLLADASEKADLTLELDFLDDGRVDWSTPIPASDWEQVSFHVTPPVWWDAVRFRIRKSGDARAVIAMIRAQSDGADACAGAPVVLTELPAGSPCTTDAACAGACADNPVLWLDPKTGDSYTYAAATCGECDESADCGAGEACALAWGEVAERQCAPAGAKAVGETCAIADECASALCCDNQCAECCGEAPCSGGATCLRARALDPWTCDDRPRAPGSGCLHDGDCASGHCAGKDLVQICNPDGRPCETDADCPDWAVYLGAVCRPIGVADGVCD